MAGVAVKRTTSQLTAFVFFIFHTKIDYSSSSNMENSPALMIAEIRALLKIAKQKLAATTPPTTTPTSDSGAAGGGEGA
jgi:hypothetical protein